MYKFIMEINIFSKNNKIKKHIFSDKFIVDKI